MLNRAQLPDNIDELKILLSAQWTEMDALKLARDTLKLQHDTLKLSSSDDKQEIQRLSLLLDMLRRKLFGQKSEKLNRQIDQLELELEALHISQGERIPAQQLETEVKPRSAPQRRPLPEHLPRETQTHLPEGNICPDCGQALDAAKVLGEDVSEVLEYVPASFRVIRHVRPRFACQCGNCIAQAAAPKLMASVSSNRTRITSKLCCTVKDVCHVVATDAMVYCNINAFMGQVICNRQAFELSAVGQAVHHKVD